MVFAVWFASLTYTDIFDVEQFQGSESYFAKYERLSSSG